MKRTLAVLLFCLCGFASAMAQSTDIAISVFGSYTSDANGNGLHETVTKSGGGLASLRLFPGEHKGLEVNYGFGRNSHVLTSSGVVEGRLQTDVHEISAAYVYRFGGVGGVRPFLLGGGGMSVFVPGSSNIVGPMANNSMRLMFLYGGGADWAVGKALGVRAQVRGKLYEAPDFYGGAYRLNTGALMKTFEPAVGLVYRY